jgi:asparagine synthetase B (glutamine-hydrolysing)
LPHLPTILPDPCGGLGVISQVLVASEAARSGYGYSLTGEGGDEIFLGYSWNTILLELARSSGQLLRDRYLVRYEPMVEKLLRDGFPTLTGGLLSRGDDILFATERILTLWDRSLSVENNILRINLKLGLPAILTLDEQVGRYTGVEPISPLIDHHIVEYACSVRSGDRAPIPKHMLREALKGVLPERVRMRYDKMGFPVPYAKWEWPCLPGALRSLESRKSLSFDPSQCCTMDRKTWALYSIEAWCREYIDGSETQGGD